jgi:anaerobic selenocysteine-containing dehydrogenase
VYQSAQPGSKAWANVVGRDRVNAPKDGRFDFFSRELFAALSKDAPPGRLYANDVECLPHFIPPAQTANADYPFVLVSQETMTQARGWSGVVPTLQEVYGLQTSARWESWVEIHPLAAEQLHINQDDLVWVESAAGKIRVRAKITEGIWHNAVNVPCGQGVFSAAQWGRESSTAKMRHGANVSELLASGSEKNSGVAASLPTRVKIFK